MTVIFRVGRRVQISWAKRTLDKATGLLSFQENIWQMIRMGLTQAKKRVISQSIMAVAITNEEETEDMFYKIEWIVVKIQGTESQEIEEEEEFKGFHKAFKNVFKNEMPKDETGGSLKKMFKSKIVSMQAVEEAYKKGYEDLSENNMANKLLEMGIMTNLERIEDYKERPMEIKANFTKIADM